MLYEREESIARLNAAADSAAVDRGHVALIRGEAGIGKTSLLHAFLEESGMDYLIGRCDDTSVPLLLGPFREIFEQAGASLKLDDSVDVRSQIGDVLEVTRCIVVEDLHWADEATLDLVAYIGRRITIAPVLLVITARPTDDSHVARCLAQLPREHITDISLEPLSVTAVSELAQAAGRNGLDVFEESKGNPFLVTEILATRQGVVPDRVSDSAVARLSDRSEASREMAQLLSVFPAGATWEVLELLRSDATSTLEELESDGWLELSGRRIGFRHELLRRAVEESLSSARRRKLNRAVLDVLTSTGAGAASLAHHAEQAGETKEFLENTVITAREFSRAGAHRDALTHLLRVEPHAPLLEGAEQARFAEALGMELMIGDRAADARRALRTAAELWERLGDRNAQARVMAEISTASWRIGEFDRWVAELETALDLLEGSNDTDLVVRTRLNKAQTVGMLSRWPEALAQVQQVMADARALGGRPLTMALGIRGNARRILGNDDSGRADQSSAIALALNDENETAAMTGYVNRVAASLGTLDIELIDDEITEAMAYSDMCQSEYARAQLEAHRSYLLDLRGDWDSALATISSLDEDDRDPLARIRTRAVEGAIRARRGEDSGLASIEKAYDIARATRDIQRLGPVASVLAEMTWLAAFDARSQVLEAAGLARDSGHARHWAELSLWCRRLGIESVGPVTKGPAPLLAELRGDWKTAAAGWEAMGLAYHRALTLAFSRDSGAMREAVVEVSRLGASTTANRIRAMLREQGHAVSRGPGRATLQNPGGLTNRQLEVAKLLAAGLSNQEIADRLFISPKTVDHHVSAILTHLGLPDRHSAGDWVAKQER